MAGIPDGFPRPTAKYSIMSTSVIHSPYGSSMTDTWDSDMIFFHNPLLLAYMHNLNGTLLYESNIVNPALYTTFPTTVQAYHAGLVQFANMTEKYRPLFYSVTLTPVCSALTNQGTIVIAQYPSDPRMTTVDADALSAPSKSRSKEKAREEKRESTPAPSSLRAFRESCSSQREASMVAAVAAEKVSDPANAEGHNILVRSLCESYTGFYSDVNALTVLPNTYVGAFKEGAYSVMKMSSGFEHWKSTRDIRHYSSVLDSAEFVSHPEVLSRYVRGFQYAYPYPILAGVDDISGNCAVFQRSESNIIHVSLRGMHKDAQFKLTIRVGWEFECLPQSPIAPFCNGPSSPDLSAMESYGRIARCIKDGYPEAYNSWERLVDVIEGVADAAGVVFPGAGLIGRGARWLYNQFSKPGKSQAKKASAKVQKELAEESTLRKTLRAQEQAQAAAKKAALMANLPKLKGKAKRQKLLEAVRQERAAGRKLLKR
jgi:hypothetical protein